MTKVGYFCSLQENNHMVVLDSSGNVISDFSAGTVNLYDIDDTKDGYYLPVGSRQGVRRGPMLLLGLILITSLHKRR